MKKKFSFVLAIIMVVCTLAIALVACAPKDPDPFTAVDSSKELGNIWDAWAKEHMNVSGNTLGINANINLKNSDTDMSIALQGGITQEKGVKEVLRLAVANNKKTGDNKNIVDIIINDTDGLFVNIDGLSQKPIEISELKLPSIGNLLKEGLDMSISDILPAIKPAVVELINFALDDSKVTVDPVKNKKEYDVKYTFTVQVDALVNSILDMINLEMSPEVESIVNEVKAMLEDVNLKFTIDTTGNTQTKVKKPAKNAPKYEYKGGKMTDLKIEVEGMTVNATGINLSNTIPSIAIPTDTMDLDTVLLTSRLNGTITMKDETGKSVGDYTYTINLDFEPIQLITTITECVNTGSADPIIKKMILDQKGKLYIDVAHKCGENCKINHISGSKEVSGSIMSVAFSPKDFGNNRVYVSADLRTIITTDLLHALDIWGVDSILNGTLEEEQYQFSFDFAEYLNIVKMRAETGNSESEPTPASMGIGLVSDSNPFSIGNMISEIVKGLQNDQQLTLKADDIRGILETIRPMLKENDPEEGTYWTIKKIINGLFEGADSVTFTGEYSNGEAFEQNVFELYTKDKNFGLEGKNHKVIKGEVTEWDKDAAGNVKIYKDTNGTLDEYIYNAQGGYNTQTYEIWQNVINKKADYSKNVVKVKIPNMVDEEAQDVYMNIIDIVGLDKNLSGVPQNVKLVLSAGADSIKNGGVGSSINNLFASLSSLLKMGASFIEGDMTPIIAILDSLIPPEVIIPTTITIKSVKDITWDQSKVAGIDTAQIIDPEKTYVRNDDSNKISVKNHVKVEFVDGTYEEMEVTALNYANYVDANNKITAWGTFDLEFFAYGITKKVTVKMDDSIGTDNQTFILALTDESVEKTIDKAIKNNKINASSAYTQKEMMSDIEQFAVSNGFGYEETSNLLGWKGAKIIFNKEGIFNLTLVDSKAARINFTFIITKSTPVENLYTGMSKEYEGSICGYEFTKTELEKVAANNTNTNMTITVGGTEEVPTAKFDFVRNGTYSITALDKNNKHVILTFKVTDANYTIDNIVVEKSKEVKLNEIITDISIEKEKIEQAVNAFNTTYTGKISIRFNQDEENPILTIDANMPATNYVLNMVGTKGEKVKLTFKCVKSTVERTGNVGDEIIVKVSDTGVTISKELAQTTADKWNNNATNKVKMTAEVIDENGEISFKFTLLQAGAPHTFTIKDKCDIKITSKHTITKTASVGTAYQLLKNDVKAETGYSYFASTVKQPVIDFNTAYEGKASVVADSSGNLTFDFKVAGTYTIVIGPLTINITVTQA